MEQEQIGLNFEKGVVTRGEETLMTLEELAFLVDCAVHYNDMCPIPQSEEFVADLRERIGVGMTREQLNEMKEFVKQWNSEDEVE